MGTRTGAPASRTPLSSGPERFPSNLVRDYPFGGGCSRSPAFQKFISFAVLLPESFRGGCSFGALLRGPVGRAQGLSREGSIVWPPLLRLTAGKSVAVIIRWGLSESTQASGTTHTLPFSSPAKRRRC